MRIALAQLNPVVGDVAGNAELVRAAIDTARKGGADLLVCPELTLLGYPPRDLLLRDGIVESCEDALRDLAQSADGITVLIGHPRRTEGGLRGVRNSATAVRAGALLATADKRLLPGYDVFDEDRYFDPGDGQPCIVEAGGARVGVMVCEDLWRAGDVHASPVYAEDPVAATMDRGCDLIVALNASPFIVGKYERHLVQAKGVAAAHGVPVVVVNQVGGQDDLVFEGRSFVVHPDGSVVAQLPAWEPTIAIVDLEQRAAAAEVDPLHDTYNALVLGLRDYCHKTKHTHALIGISGGIDSAVTAALAAAALGPANVTGVIMPSRYSSEGSRTDAEALADALGLAAAPTIDIEHAHAVVRELVGPHVPGGVEGVTDENIQARVRGLLLMALSNASGALVLATSNKSELAVGYSTLYGDMCGAVSVIGDVLKTRVYDLANWMNEHWEAAGFSAPPIPTDSIDKPPSAELRPDQTDQDSLPPYELLDEIIERHVEHEASPQQIIDDTGFDPALVQRTIRQIDMAEFKRHQAAIILKISHRAFGRGRPMPIVMRSSGTYTPSDPHAHPSPSAVARQSDRRR